MSSPENAILSIMKRSEAIFSAVRVPLDAVAVLLALVVSYRLREANIDLIPTVQLLEPASTLPPLRHYVLTFVLPSIFLFAALAAVLKLYAWQVTVSAWNEVGRMIVASVLWLVFVMGWYFLVEKQLFFSRVLLVHSTFFLALFVVFGRAAVMLLQRSLLQSGIGVRSVVSVGKQPISATAKDTLVHDVRYTYLGHVANLAGIQKLEADHELDLVLQTDPNPGSTETIELIDYCRSHHIGYAFLPPVFADVPHQLIVERLGLLPMIRFRPTPLDGWGRIGKRSFDVLGSVLLLTVLAIPLLCIGLILLLVDGWPILYVSRRIGEGGKENIPVVKYRSMVKDADSHKQDLAELNHRNDGPLFKVKNDPRVTKIGRCLRRWSIDEWPNLLNVFCGHMSLVGPRPHLPEEVKRYSSYQRRVFAVKPGVTGLAQVSGRSDLSFDEEVALDLKYVEEWSPLLDIWILWRTLVVVIGKKGAD